MDRKIDHIKLTDSSQMTGVSSDRRFDYEPMLGSHPKNTNHSSTFMNKKISYPIWISSMTGGVTEGRVINERLARVANKYKIGMGLGSIRKIMDDESMFETFNVRDILGEELPLAANIGIAQVEKLISCGEINKLNDLLERLKVDFLMIHINPIQEWMQKEGDRYYDSPASTILKLSKATNIPLGVKEVGQGMGPKSIEAILELPIRVFEFGAFGGTNFSKMELKRRDDNSYLDAIESMSYVGHDASSMVENLVKFLALKRESLHLKEVIISGGISSFLDGMFLREKLISSSEGVSVTFGQASKFLKYAVKSFEDLDEYMNGTIHGLDLYSSFLNVKL